MDTEGTEARLALRKRRIRLFAGLFVGLLVVLTLLGNTLLALTLPKVVAQPAQGGQLQVAYDGTAVVQPVEELNLTNPAGWKVKQVLVKEGEQVGKGQALVTYDDSGARQQLEDQQAALQKLKLQLGQLQLQYIGAAQSGDEAAKAAAKTALESANIDIASQEKHIAQLQKELTENGRLIAPVDGLVKEVHALEGTAGASAGPDVLLVNAGRGYRFELLPPAALAASLHVGDKQEVRVQGENGRAVEGTVTDIEQVSSVPDAGGDAGSAGDGEGGAPAPGYRAVFKLSDPSIRGGETVKVHLEKEGAEEDALLVPGSAVHTDGSGLYVFVVEERQGPLGNAYYAARRAIVVEETSGAMSAISGSLFEGDLVIVEAGEPLTDGTRVRM